MEKLLVLLEEVKLSIYNNNYHFNSATNEKFIELKNELIKNEKKNDFSETLKKNEQINAIYNFIKMEENDNKIVIKSLYPKLEDKDQIEAERIIAEYVKSKECHEYINKAYQKNEEVKIEELVKILSQEKNVETLGELKKFFQKLSKSFRQEQIGNLIAYIFSGNYKNDIKQFVFNSKNKSDYADQLSDYLYEKIVKMPQLKVTKEAGCEIVNNRPKKGVALAGYLDFFSINPEEQKITIGFASTNDDITEQLRQLWEKIAILKEDLSNPNSNFIKENIVNYPKLSSYKIEPVLLYTRFIADSINSVKRENATERSFNNLSNEKRVALNNLKIIALLGNLNEGIDKIRYKDKLLDLHAIDMVSANPFITGADTLSLYNKFREIEKIGNLSYKKIKFKELILEQLNLAINALESGKYSLQNGLPNDISTMLFLVKNGISGLVKNFNDTYYSSDSIQKIEDLYEKYNYLRKNKFFSLNSNNNKDLNLTYSSVQEEIYNNKKAALDSAKKQNSFGARVLTKEEFGVIKNYLFGIDKKAFNLNNKNQLKCILEKKLNDPTISLAELDKTISSNYNNWVTKKEKERVERFDKDFFNPSVEELLEKAKIFATLENSNFLEFEKIIKLVKEERLKIFNELDHLTKQSHYNRWCEIQNGYVSKPFQILEYQYNDMLRTLSKDEWPSLSLKKFKDKCQLVIDQIKTNMVKNNCSQKEKQNYLNMSETLNKYIIFVQEIKWAKKYCVAPSNSKINYDPEDRTKEENLKNFSKRNFIFN